MNPVYLRPKLSIHYSDDTVTLLTGDAATVAATLEPQSIQTVVTSPPYFGLRDYGVEGQLGAEPSPAEFVAALVAVFEAIQPALRDDGTLWVNLGDSYSGSWGNQGRKSERGTQRPINGGMIQPVQDGRYGDTKATNTGKVRPGMPAAKNLMGIPWRFAFAMQDVGWILRNDIIWAKPNGMPSSVTDRVSNKHEHLFLFSKKPRYYFDLAAIRQPLAESSKSRLTQDVASQAGSDRANGGAKTNGPMKAVASGIRFGGNKAEGYGNETYSGDEWVSDGMANPGDVWTIATQPFSGAHFATMPPALAERCVKAGCREGDTVLDPFSGSGTTGMVAQKHGRKYVGIDLNPEYHRLALKTRLAQGALA